jgi:rubrerythrin
MSDDTPDEVCEICGFPSDELNGEGECPGCVDEREADEMEFA